MELTVYGPRSVMRLPASEAMSVLKEHGSFKVYLEFINPRTDCLVQKRFEFYPDPQTSPSKGWWFLAEHEGITLRIPADMEWFAKHDRRMVVVPQKTSLLKQGRYVQVQFDLDVHASLRVDSEVGPV